MVSAHQKRTGRGKTTQTARLSGNLKAKQFGCRDAIQFPEAILGALVIQ
jgi:hypothetical protein